MSKRDHKEKFFKETVKPRFTEKKKARACQVDNCPLEGAFPAPKSRSSTRDYYWFCEDHVREYNKQWNYHTGMDEKELEQSIRSDITWNRPSWPFGETGHPGKKTHRPRPSHFDWSHLRDDFGLFSDEQMAQRNAYEETLRNKPSAERNEIVMAFRTLDIQPPADFDTIKKRYRELAKKHHPDANGGDKKAEEKLKSINLAYHVLKQTFQQGSV